MHEDAPILRYFVNNSQDGKVLKKWMTTGSPVYVFFWCFVKPLEVSIEYLSPYEYDH
jgi:hypothetical protein